MRINHKSHERRSDKETQSPMLKIFKDMMQRDTVDPEKTNLLKQKQEKKRKQYSGSRSKSDNKSMSSASERCKRSLPFKNVQEHRKAELQQTREVSNPYKSDKKESWWLWAGNVQEEVAPPTSKAETCSCVSCALKKFAGSEYACIGFLVLLFTLSVMIAFWLVFRTIPFATTSSGAKKMVQTGFGDRSKRDDVITKHTYGLNGYSDNALYPLQGLKELEESTRFSELSDIFNSDKINDIQNSDKLKNFYKKLIQTDARIRLLKKSFNDYNVMNTFGDKYRAPDRAKRSLKIIGVDGRGKRGKRLTNASDPTGFVIEKKKVLVQYKPPYSRKIVPKCSHAPKDSKSHEKQLKHPFYKNSQRLDELLDQFLDRSIPDLISDPFGLDTLFKSQNDNQNHHNNLKHEKVVHILDETAGKPSPPKHKVTTKKKFHFDKVKDQDIEKLVRPVDTDILKDYLKDIKIKEQGPTTKSANYDVLLSVSTIMNTQTKSIIDDLQPKYPILRKLMQVEEDDVDLAYNDVNEVLSDDGTPHDDAEIVAERIKRNDDQLPNEKTKNPVSINNPNWKAPILYPEELKSVIKQAALSNYRVKNTQNKEERDLNDMEYLEDYLVNEDNRLSKMAQAYSDYGVLEGRKDAVRDGKNSNIEKAKDHRVKFSVDVASMERLKKGSPSEGIRFEFRPSSQVYREDGPLEIYKTLQKHLKFNKEENSKVAASPSSFLPTVADFQELIYTPMTTETTLSYNDFKKKFSYKTDDANENGLIFTLAKGKRTLMSISEGDEDVEDDYKENDDNTDSEINEDQSFFIFEYITTFNNRTNDNITNNVTIVDKIKENSFNTNKTVLDNATKIKNTNNTSSDVQIFFQLKTKDFVLHNKNSTNNNKRIDLNALLDMLLGENINKQFNTKLYEENFESVDEKSTENKFENTDSTYSMDDFIRIVNDTFNIHTPVDDITDTNEATKFNAETPVTSDFYFENNENNTETTTDALLITTKFEINNYADIGVNKPKDDNMSDIFIGLIPNELKISSNYNNITEINSDMDNKTNNSNTTIDNYSNSFLITDLENDESLSKKIMTNISDTHNITLINNYFHNVSLKANRTEETQKTLVKSDMLIDNNKTDSVASEDKCKVQFNAKKKLKREINKTEINYVTENMISNRDQKFNNNSRFQNETNDFEIGDFLHMLSGVFASFDGIFVNENTSENKNNRSINILNVTTEEYTETNTINTTANTTHLTNVTDEAVYPISSTGMIGNIGHRSRVLLSVDDTSNATVIEKNTRDNLTNEKEIKGDGGQLVRENFKVTNRNITISTDKLAKVNQLSNTTKPQKETKTVNNDAEQKSINKNKTVVKRNVDDSSLIFWNDLYDDEYGIRSDTIENIRDKHSIKDNNFIKSSKVWIENKLKKIADDIKKTGKKFSSKKTVKPLTTTTIRNTLSMPILKKSKIDKRMIKIRDDDEQEVEKRDFAALTANMKEICKKAALAVKETRNLEVREDSRENAVATSLMGQLMKLMSDLVDYQVQQKTCLRLPADLQNFLQWLTGNESDSELDPSQKLYYRNDDVNADMGIGNDDKPTEKDDLDLLSSPSSEKEEIIPERSDCLGTLRDVQDLILLFDQMSEEDKSKMAGVKEYLVNQMDFLQKLPSYSDYNTFQIHKNYYPLRYKRDLKNNSIITRDKRDEKKRQPRRKLAKFIKIFGKKHTRTTANFYDSLQFTESISRAGKKESSRSDRSS